WGNVTEIGPEILDISQVVNFEYIPAEHEFSKQHSFKLDVPPHRHLYIRVNKGIESAGGYILAQVHDYINRVPEYPREIEIMGKGSLLNLSGDKKLSIISRGNQGLHFQVGYVMPDQIQHLVSQTQGEFQNPSFKNYWFDEDNITQRFEQHGDLPQVPPGNSVFTSFDFSSYLQRQDSKIRNGVFMLTVKGWDPVRKRTTGVAEKRLILITDLGVMAKKNADNSRDVFVMSVDKGRPVQGAKVNVLGINGVSVFSEVTDSNGHVSIPDLKEFKREKKASVIFVTQNNDLSFIPYDRNDRRLDMSQFDVGGVQQYGKGDVLSAYLFSDRGIYRPGDSFNIGMIVKSTDWTRDLKDIPLQVVVTDPRGLVIKEKKFPLSDAGFESLTYNTRNSSPTGEYEVKLYLVKDKYGRNLLGSTTVKLEEFLPDRMKISSRFSQERSVGWVHPKDLTARVSLKNLYGTPASERRISSSMTLSPYNPVFQKYSAFRFFDPLKAKKGFTERLTEELTDEEGQAEITLDLERFASASYNVSLYVNGFEAEGGRSVSTERSLLVSPREFLIGYKSDGSLDYVGKDSLRQIRLIAVDPSLELTGADKLKIELLEQRYISALVKQDNGTYKYQSVLKEKTLNESEITITDKGLDYKLPTEVPGDFILLIKDVDGLELNKVRFSVAGEANLAGSLEKNAELQVRLNKKDYQPGEMIEVNIRAPYAGAGLITIERDKVYDYKWFSSQSTNTVQTIRLPHGLEGNAYVNVSFIRDIA
ncbi:MAG: MG2 domain-containing protein, partial [Gammaproteobacteria bacterium]|nr:MG2 domain-containing protein [Gammaproteobacteria bacterium]